MCERLQKALEVKAQTEPCTAYSKTQAPFISVCKAGMFSMVTDVNSVTIGSPQNMFLGLPSTSADRL